ncbi:28S ribosomal protein S7, mitochondrial [Tribolium madens]|uniref:28S ribosomal protein S7, mitochondrial n=1 Tax=Tribolium madens TaxID=41895 RepID=UPI001CF759F5|nr:28S ribosomal protein S7, mitochondrial [Tribolium madens]
MAAIKLFSKNFQIIKGSVPNLSIIIQKNGMSQYPSYYIQPVHKKEVQEELVKTGEAQKLVHMPTRAALNNQTCSPTQDDLVSLFTNYIMRDGLKPLARGLVEQAFENIKRIQLEKYHKCQDPEEKAQIELDPRVIFHKAVENCKPIMNLTPIKRGGVRYQVPVPITRKRSQFMSMKWLILASKEKDKNVRFHYQLALELIDAANNKGRVVKRKQDLHKQCEANRAYAHYRWS